MRGVDKKVMLIGSQMQTAFLLIPMAYRLVVTPGTRTSEEVTLEGHQITGWTGSEGGYKIRW